jgi:thymidine kinase
MDTQMIEEGYLELILGPMFSGKTTRLIQIYKEFTYIQQAVLVINYYADTRYDSTLLSTHDKTMIPCVHAKKIGDVNTWKAHDVIIINEGQFFQDIFESVLEMVDVFHKRVYICGLDGDFKRNKFGTLLDLIPHADEVTKLKSLCAICKNGKRAIFSKRVSTEDSQIVIGSDNYIPLCRNCYNNSG